MTTGKILEVGQKWKTRQNDYVVEITHISDRHVFFRKPGEYQSIKDTKFTKADFRWAFWTLVE